MNTMLNRQGENGFTLIEIMIVLMLTAIALLALGTFSASVINSGTVSRQRLAAVHLAEQVIEEWQQDKTFDYVPRIDTGSDGKCRVRPGTSATLPSPVSCVPGKNTPYTVTLTRTAASAPLPTKPNNSTTFNPGAFAIRTMTGTPQPYTKVVTVNWNDMRGDTHTIYLTHMTRK